MSDRRLQVFQTVARLLSFTKAAEELHMTQPAVTFQVRQLEEQFNTRLFDRTHNRISLTEAGQRVFQYADQIFVLYAEMDNAVRELTGDVSGVLMLGASTTIAEYMLPVLLGDFKTKYPDITIRLKVANTDGIVSQVENNTIDLGVVEAPVNNKNLVVEKCRTDHLVLIVSPKHELAGEAVVPIQRVADFPFICREEGSGTREVMIESMEQAGMPANSLKIAMELGSLEAIKGAVEAGMGISILSSATIQKELKLGTLIAIQLDPPIDRPFSFVHQKQKFRVRAMDELLTFARNYCQSHKDDPLG
ncbi:MAG: LysR family transcriptional regulator [Proteobacteria bacterium]|jgi:DNA-binding transcriptional LysR family regulator|nr:LysR family transcriptional regulator [Pseudomonadota bacterium]